nr:ribonuclease H-like domain-containing protein [Tanacetum cinerariifolium]
MPRSNARGILLVRYKFNADGSLSRYKAWLVANGSTQQKGIDCDENSSPVVNPTTIRTVLSLAVSQDWPIHQPDVKNAFLHSHLSETRSTSGMFLSQSKFAEEILERAHMQNCNPCSTPVDIESKIGSDGTPISHFTSQSCEWQSKTKKRNTKESKRNIQLSSSSIDDSSLNEDARDFESRLELLYLLQNEDCILELTGNGYKE